MQERTQQVQRDSTPRSDNPTKTSKLLVGAANDAAEREADTIADRVVDNLGFGSPVDEVTSTRIRRSVVAPIGPEGGEVDADTQAVLDSGRGRGRALDPSLRRSMEGAFGGADFGGVRIHSGGESAELNARLGARAFTLDNDVYLGASAPAPSSPAGRHLLAHELAHTQQQRGGARRSVVRRDDTSPGGTKPAATPKHLVPEAKLAEMKATKSFPLSKAAEHLDRAMGTSTKGRLGVGASSYAGIRKLVVKYEKAKAGAVPEDKLIGLLEQVDAACKKWLRDHEELEESDKKTRKGKQAVARRDTMETIIDQVATERARLEKGTYEEIKSLSADYGKATAENERVILLDRLERACLTWLNEHRKDLDDQDEARRTEVSTLSDKVVAERAELSQKQSQDLYIDTMAAGHSMPLTAQPTARPGVAGFKALTPESRGKAASALDGFVGAEAQAKNEEVRFNANKTAEIKEMHDRMAFVQAKGLTPAEHAAIMAYTVASGDFHYMNAAAANSESWMQTKVANEKKRLPKGNKSPWAENSLQTLREEGALHTAVAMQGLAKLDPYQGLTYRGQSMPEKDFRAQVAKGKKFTISYLSSTSKDWSIASGFAGRNVTDPIDAAKIDADKRDTQLYDLAVVWLYDPSCGGKDVEMLSTIAGEKEVLMVPGMQFEISSVTQVGAGGGAPPPMAAQLHKDLRRRMAIDFKNARAVYIVHMMPMANSPAPLPASKPAAGPKKGPAPRPGSAPKPSAKATATTNPATATKSMALPKAAKTKT